MTSEPVLTLPKARGVRTPGDVRAEFDRLGLSIEEWAEANGVNRHTVDDLLRGKTTGRRGESHKAAVLLGMKKGVIRDTKAARR